MYQISQIATLIGARRVGDTEQRIDRLLTDSRSLCFPETTLFFALRTPRGDGHLFIPELYRRGVRSFVVDSVPSVDCPGANFLVVPNTLQALQRLAERHRDSFNIPIIGIAGSNGKTTVKEWLYQLLSPDYNVTRSPRSYNSKIGVPLSVWGLWEQSQIGIFEAAISEPDEMQPLQRIIQPTIGVFTSLGLAHQENFQTLEQKCREKLQLFRDAEALIYPVDDAVVWKCVRELDFKGKLIPMHTTGNAFNDNRQLCAHVCRYLGMDESVLQQRLSSLEPVAMRLEVKEGRNGCILINDSYNSDLNSLDIALDFMNRRQEPQAETDTLLPRTLVLSDIQQTALGEEEFYNQVAKRIAARGVEHFIGVGPALCRQKSHFRQLQAELHFFTDTDSLKDSTVFAELKQTLILIKGARSFGFENLSDLLELKVHETILEVNLNAVVDNLNHYRSFLHPQTRMVCMVKADAYGAGAIEIAKTLQEHRVDYLAVAVADEGAQLRHAGISSNIMIMNPEMTSFHTLFRYHLEPEVYNFRILEALIRAAEHEGITDFPIHIKLDTGMHRLGFDPLTDMPRLVSRLQQQTALIPRSVFSHFVGSDADEFDEFSAQQYSLFEKGADLLQNAFHHHILRHICNSAAIEHFPNRQLDMVRLGLGLYGVNSRNNELLQNVSTLRTTILQIRNVEAGDSVGYSRKTVLTVPSRIAALPIGYADGLDRRLGNYRGYCLVNGCRAPYVGNICMDVCMIDVTGIPCQEGDTAVIFGAELSPSVLASQLDTIPYEIFTSVSNRVKRIYTFK